MTAVITWAVRVITATATIGCGLWAAIAVRERFARAGQVWEDARNDVGDDTLAMLLDGLPGRGNPQASGVSRHDETGIGEWTDAEQAFLRGHRETPDE